MPELPEVETVLRRISPILIGGVVREIIHLSPSLRYPIQSDFSTRLVGQGVHSVTRQGKYIFIHLNNSNILLVHLGMSGMFEMIDTPSHEKRKHDHLIARLDKGAFLVFHDPRRFGDLRIFEGKDDPDYIKYTRNLGIDALDPALTPEIWIQKASKSRVPIKNFLLDQSIVAGIGNIYACEALYQASISPIRSAQQVTKLEWDALHTAILDVLQRALISGGSTLRDFRDQQGNGGYFQHDFHVYDRAGELCRHCSPAQDAVIIRIIQSGRSSFYCPHHQL